MIGGRMVVIAHRGASAYAPEHTLPAYDMALDMGADYIEQDLQMTRDGVLVVLHDDTLNRTTRGQAHCTGKVIDRTFAELQACDAGRWFMETHPDSRFEGLRIPSLEEVLRRYRGRARFYIETKQPEAAPGMEQMLVDLLREFDLSGEPAVDGLPVVIVQSFSAASLQLVRSIAPGLPLVQLFENIGAAAIAARLDAVREYAEGIGPSRNSTDAALVAAAVARGLAVHPYTVNQEPEMRRLIDCGVHGMFTDVPDLLLRLR
jgi:glycerophosphoryl diester phosphodiesterase